MEKYQFVLSFEVCENSNNIAAARLAGLEDDLKLNKSGTQFSVSENQAST